MLNIKVIWRSRSQCYVHHVGEKGLT